jgi:hypothetical protein
MKASSPGGRFNIPFERRSILSGITQDLRIPVGQTVNWWRWDAAATGVDDVYDVGSLGTGRRWKTGFDVPAVNAVIYQGVTLQDERGFYNTDILRVTLNMEDVERLFPTMPTSSDDFLRDRIIYRNEVFRPTHFFPRGLIKGKYTLFTLDASQVNPEEMVNDDQFTAYSN